MIWQKNKKLVKSYKLHYNKYRDMCMQYTKKERNLKTMEENKKRYPISMWAKLTRVVYDTPEIPNCYKEEFIDIVGGKVAAYRNQKFHHRYKPQELPVDVKGKHCSHMDNYHTILNKSDEDLKPILADIYNCMKMKWFNEPMGG